jgi:hypothetical protein
VEAMTEPTQAQIEAAANAMIDCMFAPHELPIDDELWCKYFETAKAALTAAAEVGDTLMERLEYSRGYNIGWETSKVATIERCTQWLKDATVSEDINIAADAMRRSLKDES